MDILRQIGGSLLLAVFSVALVVGGISLALAESYVPVVPTPTVTEAQVSIFSTNAASTLTPTQTLVAFSAVPPSLTPSITIQPPTTCPPPAGWIPVSVQPGDTLAVLAVRYQSTPENLRAANCLFSNDLPVGSIIYVPPIPTQTSVPCGPPYGWVRYTVRPGNTLTSLSQAYGVSVAQLQFANCMASNQYYLAVGQVIWVPNVATRTPRATATATLTPVSIVFPTVTWTASVTPLPTNTFVPTNSPVPTNTFVPTATQTTIPSPTMTATVPTPTTPPTATATITAFPTATFTPPSPAP
jgi:LysM repeat protein